MGILSRWRTAGEAEDRVLSLAVRVAINAASLWLAAKVVGGVEISGLRSVIGVAAIFGVVNASIKPVAHIFGLPLTCLTFGVFALVINAAMLVLAAGIAGWLGLEVSVAWFWPALWGALIISVVSALLSAFVGRPRRRTTGD